MVSWALGSLNLYFFPVPHLLEHLGVTIDLAEDVYRAGWLDLIFLAHGCEPKEDAEGFTWGPVGYVSQFYHCFSVLWWHVDRYVEVYLVSPEIGSPSEG